MVKLAKEAIAITETITLAITEAMSVWIRSIATAHTMAETVVTVGFSGMIGQLMEVKAKVAKQTMFSGKAGINRAGAIAATAIRGSRGLLRRILRPAKGGQCKGHSQGRRTADK